MEQLKKILIIAHFYEPLNTVASHRPAVWARELVGIGFDVTVITRKWSGKERTWDEILADDINLEIETEVKAGVKIIRLPFKTSGFFKLSQRFKKNRFVNFFLNFAGSIFGYVEIDRPIDKCYYENCDKHLKSNKYDFLIVTCNPFSGINLAKKLANKHSLRWAIDLRDMWDMKFQIREGNKVPLSNKIKTFFTDKKIYKGLAKADLIITCNQVYIDILRNKIGNKEYLKVLNGFEVDLFKNLKDNSIEQSKFTILCLGTLHLQQNKKNFALAFNRLVEKYGSDKIILKFLGVDVNPIVSNEIQTLFNNKAILTTGFIEREKALLELKNCHLAYYPMWEGYFGLLPVKFLEYLGAEKNILISPKDNSVLDDILEYTNAGISISYVDEIFHKLEDFFIEWQQNKVLDFKADRKKIAEFTRESQTEVLINWLKLNL